MAWDIFATAFGNLFGRLGAAIKASLFPMILLIVVVVGFTYAADAITRSQNATGTSGVILILIVLGLIVPFALFCLSWVAVLWHRAAIWDIDPGFFPDYRGINIPSYVGRLIVLGLIILASLIPIALIGGLIGGLFGISNFNSGVVGLTVAGTILNFIFGIIVSFIWLRISATLPGIALGHSIALGDGWRKTADIAGPIFGVACILTLMNILISATTIAFAGTNLIVMQLLQIPMSWLSMMLGLSLMTEIYKRSMHVDAASDVFE